MTEPHLRAADADRTAVAGVLGEHMAAGRLSLAEYDERLAKAYAAKTYGELSALTADLPTHSPTRLPQPAPAPGAGAGTAGASVARQGGRWGGAWNSYAWQAWLRTSLIVTVIWAVTALASWEFTYFWPIWVIGPWGGVLLVQSLTGGSDHEDGGQECRPRRLGR
jgi:hypothetical protein